MLRPPSSLRSLFHLSGRLRRPPNPRFPGPPNPPLPSPSSPLYTRSRFHSSSSSPNPGGADAGRATHDYDPLIESLCASASDTPLDPDTWAIYDPVSGRIVIQRLLPLWPSSIGEEGEKGEGAGERGDEEKAGGQEKHKVKAKRKRKRKGRASSTGEGQTSGPSVAASGNSAGKGGKEKVFYVCSHCGEAHQQWWGICRHCQMKGTLQKSRETVPQSLQEVNIAIQGPPLSSSSTTVDEEEGAGEHEDEKVGVKEKKGEGKRKWKRQGRARASGKQSLGKGSKESVLFECSNCGEGYSQWWGICRHCKASRTLHRRA